jgi:hypothetical protein
LQLAHRGDLLSTLVPQLLERSDPSLSGSAPLLALGLPRGLGSQASGVERRNTRRPEDASPRAADSVHHFMVMFPFSTSILPPERS